MTSKNGQLRDEICEPLRLCQYICVLVVFLVLGCGADEDSIDSLENRIDSLIIILGSEDAIERKDALSDLVLIGKPAVSSLITALSDKDWRIREGAAKALGQIGDEQAIPALIEALDDEYFVVRQGVVEALGQIGGAEAVPPLIEALSNESLDIRRSAVDSLRKIGTIEAKNAVAEYEKEQSTSPVDERQTPNHNTTPIQISPCADPCVWVNGYTRKNGTRVKGHWRSKPGCRCPLANR